MSFQSINPRVDNLSIYTERENYNENNAQIRSPAIQQTNIPTSVSRLKSKHSHKRRARLPIIVDVALDRNGKQVYQVHETTKLIRLEMPKSLSFSSNYHVGQDGTITQPHAMPTSMPNAIPNAMPNAIPHSMPHSMPHTMPHSIAHTANLPNTDLLADKSSGLQHYKSQQHTSSYAASPAHTRLVDDDIWSQDVERAFEHVLQFIPKSNSNKIKIAGRSCGRNELISDYIYAKTGKRRTKKQVSSHIQVIKNLGQKTSIIQLINDGPIFSNEEDKEKMMKIFEKVFTRIYLDMSIGVDDVRRGSLMDDEQEDEVSKSQQRRRRRRTKMTTTTTVTTLTGNNNSDMDASNIVVSQFAISLQKEPDHSSCSLLTKFTSLATDLPKKQFNPEIFVKFPDMREFIHRPNIAVIHNTVNLFIPEIPTDKEVASLDSMYELRSTPNTIELAKLTKMTKLTKLFNSFTSIYSFGKPVFKFEDSHFKLYEKRNFLPEFWKPFLCSLAGTSSSNLDLIFSGLTMKQIIYESKGLKHEHDSSYTSKSRIRVILLWEFSRVHRLEDGFTTSIPILLKTPDMASLLNPDIGDEFQRIDRNTGRGTFEATNLPLSVTDKPNNNENILQRQVSGPAIPPPLPLGAATAATAAAATATATATTTIPAAPIAASSLSSAHVPSHLPAFVPGQGLALARDQSGYVWRHPLAHHPNSQLVNQSLIQNQFQFLSSQQQGYPPNVNYANPNSGQIVYFDHPQSMDTHHTYSGTNYVPEEHYQPTGDEYHHQ